MSRALWWIVAAAALTGCGLGRWLTPGEPVDVVEVGRAQLCGADAQDVRLRLFESVEAAAAWQQRSGIDLRMTGALEQGRHALIEMGQRSTGGYGVAVSREGRIVGGALHVYATFFRPAPGAMTTQMLTSPCVLVRLPDADFGAVEVYDQDGERRASSATE